MVTNEIRSYKDLHVWQKAMTLAEQIYALTSGLPKTETYGLVVQMQKAAVSIPSNIAEGHARDSTREYLRFLSISSGSLAELETQLMLCDRLAFVAEEEIEPVMKTADDVGRQLRALRQALQSRLHSLREPTDCGYVVSVD